MKAQYLLILLLVSTAGEATAQVKADSVRKFGMHITPSPLIDYTPRYRIGFEFHSGDFGYGIDFGYGDAATTSFIGIGSNQKDYRFFEVRPEVKYYFKGNLDYFRPYVSSEIFAIYHTDKFTDSYYYPGDVPIIYYDRATFEKVKSGIHLKGGIKTYGETNICIDIYAGLGVAYRMISLYDVVNPVEGEFGEFEEFFVARHKLPGNDLLFHITLGAKFGFFKAGRGGSE